MNRADDAYIVGTMDTERYRRQVERIKEQRVAIHAELTVLVDRLQDLNHTGQRGQRLTAIRDSGLQLLNHPDIKLSNAWLRQRFCVWVANNQIQQVEYL